MLNYDQRMSIIREWFKKDILTRFTPPQGVDPKVAADDAMEAVNSNLSSHLTKEPMDWILSQVARELTRNARARSLPLTKDFVSATRMASEGHREAHTGATRSSGTLDTFKVNEGRVRRGEPISEQWLRGSMREMLLANTSLTEKDLAPYDKAIDNAAYTQHEW